MSVEQGDWRSELENAHLWKKNLRPVPCKTARTSSTSGIGAVHGDDGVPVAEDSVSVMEEKAAETGVRTWLEEGGDGELGELHFRVVRDV